MKIKLGYENLSPDTVAEYCSGILVGGEIDHKIEYVCTDSREVDEKTLFIVTVGERVDGHSFIGSAMEKGCKCFLCQYVPEGIDTTGGAFIVVPDSVAAISFLAKGYRGGTEIQNIAITGSVGKTTTKELVSAVMRQKYKAYNTDGNFNSVIGMPLSLMEAPADAEMGIFEMGMSGFGEIHSMSMCATPSLAIVTNIGSSHLEYLKTRENICRAKLEIADGLMSGGYLLLNSDEPLLREARSITGRDDINYIYVSLGECENADYKAVNIRLFEEYSLFDIEAKGIRVQDVRVDIPGIHIVFNSLMAYAAANISGLSEDEIRRGILSYVPCGNRQNIYVKSGVRIIADCYNAAPESMRAALGVLSTFSGRRIAVLGDMLELGEDSDRMHGEIGEYLLGRADILFAYGENAKKIVDGAKRVVISAIYHFEKSEADSLTAELNSALREGDTVLFKGSRAMKLETIIEKLEIR